MTTATNRPEFIDAIGHAYARRGKSVVLLTGNTLDIYRHEGGDHTSLEQVLYHHLSQEMDVIRLDASNGISFYSKSDEDAIVDVYLRADRELPWTAERLNPNPELGEPRSEEERKNLVRATRRVIKGNQHKPLAALRHLDSLLRAYQVARSPRPLGVIVQYAGSLFPPGEFNRLQDIDRQRLVTFLNTITDPEFIGGRNLVVMVADTRPEVNTKIMALPHAEEAELSLPGDAHRATFVDAFCKMHTSVSFDKGRDAFVEETAGLTLTGVQDLLEVSERTATPITRQAVLDEVNLRLKAELGDIVKIVRPEHSPDDIIGYDATKAILTKVYRRCEKPDTAIAAVILSGANGNGKTYQAEAFAKDSGRIVLTLGNIRSEMFGGTDRLFAKLRLLIETYGKIQILVDEAHTQFGSVHSADTHKTEKRLSGSIISMMSNPLYLSKVVWILMTSRPDQLDPDVKSRAPVQIPIFDLEGDERRTFVRHMFARKKIELSDAELDFVLKKTGHYSNRDFRNLTAEVLAERADHPDTSITEVLEMWGASTSIVQARQLQALIAAQHCSYPRLLPAALREASPTALQQKIDQLRS